MNHLENKDVYCSDLNRNGFVPIDEDPDEPGPIPGWVFVVWEDLSCSWIDPIKLTVIRKRGVK